MLATAPRGGISNSQEISMTAAAQTAPRIQSRPPGVIAAVAITLLTAVLSLVTIPLIPEEAPEFVLYMTVAFSVVTVAISWGVWQLRKWAAIALFVFTLLNGLSAVPGLPEAPVICTVGIIMAAATCIFLALPSTRRTLR
jgi:hypothetical protein